MHQQNGGGGLLIDSKAPASASVYSKFDFLKMGAIYQSVYMIVLPVQYRTPTIAVLGIRPQTGRVKSLHGIRSTYVYKLKERKKKPGRCETGDFFEPHMFCQRYMKPPRLISCNQHRTYPLPSSRGPGWAIGSLFAARRPRY